MEAPGRLRPYLPTGAAILLAVLLRAPSVATLAYPDEGGLLLVARQWHGGGPGLYGDLWVDRPPLLLLFWKAAAGLGGVPAARVLAMLAVAVLVVAAAWVGRLVGGRRAARHAAFLAAALACSPLLGATEVDAELLAVPLVLLACGAALKTSAASPRAQAGWALLAGVAGTSALLVKQNLADGLVFGAALAVSAGLTGRWTRATAARVLGFGTLGAAVVVASTLGWVVTDGPGIDALASTLFGFRAQAADVIARGSLAAPESRLLKLVVAGVASGLLVVLVVAVGPLRHGVARRQPVAVATVATALFGLAGIAAGGSFWQHYALELLPAAVLAIAIGVAEGSPVVVTARAVVTLAVVSTVVAVVVALTPLVSLRHDERGLAAWLARAHRPQDSAVVTYGHADLIEAAGLRAPHYPYLWSLPIRARDPRLSALGDVLAGPDAPTWLVEWDPVDTWGLDSRGMLAHVIARDYRSVGRVCGVPVYLRRDEARTLPATPTSC